MPHGPALAHAHRSRTVRRHAAPLRTALLTFLAVSAMTAASGSAATAASAPGLLAQARAVVSKTTSLHFVLVSSGVGGGGLRVTGGHGDIARPGRLTGSLTVDEVGLSASVGVLASGGRFFVRLPFQSSYARTNPATYGITDPSALLNPGRGLNSLLAAARSITPAKPIRLGGEVIDQVRAVVPGSAVTIPPDPEPRLPVNLVVGITPRSHQVRTLALTGPFGPHNASATYRLTLTAYDKPVHVSVPAS